MALQPLGPLLARSLRRSGADVEKQANATHICSLWADVVRSRCSPALACRSDALSYSSGVLIVGVIGSSVASELRYVQHLLIAEVNEKVGHDVVKRVQFRVVGVLSEDKGRS